MASKIDIDRGIAVIVALAIVGILAAFLLAPAITDIQGVENNTFIQDEGTTVTPEAGKYNGTLDNVSQTNSDITVTVTDIDSGDSEQNTIPENQSADYTVNGNDVTVFNNEIVDGNTANVTYQNEVSYGWSSGSKSLYNILDLLIILVLFIVVIGWGMANIDV